MPLHNAKSRRRLRKDVPWRKIGSEGILLDLVTGDYFKTGPVGILICSLLNGRASSEKIAKKVSSKFNISKATAKRDISHFTEVLLKHGLLESY